MKRWLFILAVFILLGAHQNAYAQLLYTPGMAEENYAREGYQKYGQTMTTRQANPIYDGFGSYIFNGVRAFEWIEEKRNSRHLQAGEAYSGVYKQNWIDEGYYFDNYLNNLVVVSESQKSFSSRFIVGNRIRAKFSPLTLDMVAFNGIRWDTNINNNTNVSFLSSRADIPMSFALEYINPALQNRLLPVYLTAGHIDHQFGIFNIAANYVNTYRSDSSQSRQKNSITGTLPYYAGTSASHRTTKLIVKFEDGSMFDGNGPKIYQIYPVINGEKRTDLLESVTKGTWSNDFKMAASNRTTNVARDFYVNKTMIDPLRVPQFSLYKNGDLPYVAQNPSADIDFRDISESGENYLNVNGGEYLLFWYNIPADEEVKDVVFHALVSNDYEISMSEMYTNDRDTQRGVSASYFYPIEGSEGNVKDDSNFKWVTFRWGRETANMIMGLKIDSHIKGFDLTAEYNRNMRWRQFFHTDGKKYRTDSDAYYVNLKKEFGRLTIGTEVFKIDPFYSTSFHNIDKRYYDMKEDPASSWTDHFINNAVVAGATGYSDAIGYLNSTRIIDSVDDNDDKDQYPDFHIYSEVSDRNGIFPGLDMNGNNRPDTNENGNLMPDYAEPFFLYYSDPEEYDYGDDLNNNGVIDTRENDARPDYPYNQDTKGHHIFGSWGEETGMKYTIGFLDFEEIYGGGITDVRYGKLEYKKFIPFFAEIDFASTFKKVEDSVVDNTFSYERRLSTTLADSFTYVDNYMRQREGMLADPKMDLLRYRDSYVSTSYFETDLFHIPNMNINFKIKYDINHQNETTFQEKNDIIERTHVFRAEYKYYLEKLLINPQVKVMTRKMTNHDDRYRPLHEQYFYPIIRAEYPLTMNTTLKAGAQGFPGLNSTARNLVNDQLNYDERHYLIMVTNRSLYNGYDFSLNMGYEINWQDLKGIMRDNYDRTDKLLFLRLVVGMEPIS